MESTNEFQKSSSILREVISPTLVTYKLDYTPPRNFVCICMYIYIYILHLVGGFNHLEKYESRWEGLSHILWKILVNVPDHQPDIYIYIL